MSRLEITAPDKASWLSRGSTKIWSEESNQSPGLCPVDMTRAFLEMCHTHTCGKMVCRAVLVCGS